MCSNHCCLLSQEERDMWQKRPCPIPLLKVMALSVIHLQPLRLVLLDTLMTDYMSLVDAYINSSYYQPDELHHVTMVSSSQISWCFLNFFNNFCSKTESFTMTQMHIFPGCIFFSLAISGTACLVNK